MNEAEELERFRRAVRRGPGTMRWLVFVYLQGLAAEGLVDLVVSAFGATCGVVAEVALFAFLWKRERSRRRR